MIGVECPHIESVIETGGSRIFTDQLARVLAAKHEQKFRGEPVVLPEQDVEDVGLARRLIQRLHRML